MNGYWFNGVWYPYGQVSYVYPIYADQSTKVIEQLLKRIADLEAKLDSKI